VTTSVGNRLWWFGAGFSAVNEYQRDLRNARGVWATSS